MSPACKTDAASEVKAVTEGSLLKWRVGRYSLVKPAKSGEPNEQKTGDGTVACSITTEDVRKQLGEAKLASVEKAIGDVWKVRDKRQTSPIFRPLQQSRELVATYNGQEFVIEKMFQSRDAIAPDSAQESVSILMELATDPKFCPKIPN